MLLSSPWNTAKQGELATDDLFLKCGAAFQRSQVMTPNLENGKDAMPFTITNSISAPSDHAPHGLSVLLVDDTTAYQKVLRSLLMRRGHNVAIANHGGEAVELFLHGGFDVVLMDIHMPIMNGFEAALAIREHEVVGQSHVPIIAITTQATAVSQEKCFAAGMDAYLLKPIDVAQLFQMVETLGDRGHPPVPSMSPTFDNSGNAVNPKSVVDAAGSIKRLGGDTELFKEIVHIFDEDSPAIIRSLRQAVSVCDSVNVERFAHSLKGLTANFGAQLAINAAGRLEEMGRNRKWDGVDQAVEELMVEITRLSAVLNEFRTT